MKASSHITPALIAGAFCERMRFRGYLVFIGLWSLLVYSPFAHSEWGGGFLGSGGLHAIDFAGGSVVHELAGAAALATALYLRRRHQLERPHSVPLVLLGAADLAAITPASGYVQPWAAIIIGAAAGLLCYGAVHLKDIFHYDDSLDVVGVHMIGGAIGVLLTGVFASLAVNAAGEAGGWTQLGRQAVLALVGIAYPFIMTWIILWVTDHVIGLQVSPDDEAAGLDLAEHAETGYQLPQTPVDMTSDTMAASSAAPVAPLRRLPHTQALSGASVPKGDARCPSLAGPKIGL